jgi:hypothetical protein
MDSSTSSSPGPIRRGSVDTKRPSSAMQEHRARLARASRERRKQHIIDLEERVHTYERFIDFMRAVSRVEGRQFGHQIEVELDRMTTLPPLALLGSPHRSTPSVTGLVASHVTLSNTPPFALSPPAAASSMSVHSALSPPPLATQLSDATPSTLLTSIFSSATHPRR